MSDYLQDVIKMCLNEILRPVVKLLTKIIKWLSRHGNVLIFLVMLFSFVMFVMICSALLSIIEIIVWFT